MATYSNPQHPLITLFGATSTSQGIEKYGVSDNTGLGPNGADKYKTFTATVSGISDQIIGDNSVTNGLGLSNGGKYNGNDIQVGHYISDVEGLRTFKIIEVTSKSEDQVTIIYEDVWMSVAKGRSDRNNFFGESSAVVIYGVNDNNDPLIDSVQADNLGSKYAIDRIQTYFNVYQPQIQYTLEPDRGFSNVSVGDIVTITGDTTGYEILKVSSGDDIPLGTVSQKFGENTVILRVFNKIIREFEKA